MSESYVARWEETDVDHTQNITSIEMCFGYGGIHLGLQRAIPNLRLIAACEIETFACANMVAKMEAGLMEPAPIWTDLKTFPWSEFRDRVHILVAGYPCQPFSAAGKRLGKDDPRHLWPYIADGIARMRPGACFFENVEGHISMGLPDVIEDLAGLGYRTTWGIFSASEVGAPHQRKRVFILAKRMAHRDGLRFQQHPTEQDRWHWQDLQEQSEGGCASELAHRVEQGLEGLTGDGDNRNKPGRIAPEAVRPIGSGGVSVWPSRPGEPQHGWEPPRVVGNAEKRSGVDVCGGGRDARQTRQQRDIATSGGSIIDRQIKPALGGDADGPAGGLDYAELCVTCDNRTDELRLLGNGVVPQQCEKAFRVLYERLKP